MKVHVLSMITIVSAALVTASLHADTLQLSYYDYDNFNDNSIDTNKWNVKQGSVAEINQRLDLRIYHDGILYDKDDQSSVTTLDKPGGMGILGFKLNSDRTGGHVGGGDAEAFVGIKNGADYIRINWLSDVNDFVIRANGTYGSGDIFRWDPGFPDGPLEIRDNGNNTIDVLHNHSVKYTFTGQHILPDSYFHAVAYGDSGGGEDENQIGSDFALSIDDVQFATVPVPAPSSSVLVGGIVACWMVSRLICSGRSRHDSLGHREGTSRI